ncbi:peptide deformylase [Borreliella americana]|uniref:peptide deformylase n=1 Tax=Borreliella americana TaxID=478807 RepID=UPI001E58922E|nr:peptide deformylase [Borreliella americana]MCD2332492.1 peptide deformylase [Borreliella americana]MCD2349807.1 peptide deformylase [Borreliella americana]MCD2382343.1 peptide deformylase [Borreliella americana]
MKMVFYPNDLLRVKTKQIENIDNKIKDYAKNMIELMDTCGGVGLAAPQVGLDLALFVVRENKMAKPLVFINPSIVETSYELSSYKEGCLSIPGVYYDLMRPKSVVVNFHDENGKSFTIENSDFLARIIQHEMDHLNGVLFIDYYEEKLKNKLLKPYMREIGLKAK